MSGDNAGAATVDNMEEAGPQDVESHYEVLGVMRNANLQDIKTAYHKSARSHHPDKTSSAISQGEEAFLLVQKAWECLRDHGRRKEYDEKMLVSAQRMRAKKHSAIPITKEDCVPEEAVDEEGTSIFVLVYTCRCGEEIDIDPTSSEDDDGLFVCPGCSLVYNASCIASEKE